MRLKINNFAKIKDADIIIDGITVIAGENDTGKSTVGKILFSLFNALSNIDEKIFEERLKEIENTNKIIIQNNIPDTDLPRYMVSHSALSATKRISILIRHEIATKGNITDDILWEIVEKTIKSWWKSTESEEYIDSSDTIEEVYKNTNEVLNLPEERIILEIVTRYFNRVFHGQTESLLTHESGDTTLELEIKGKKEKLFFQNNYCREFIDNVKILHKAIYIDNPFVIDELSRYRYGDMSPMNELLVELLNSKSKDGVLDGVIETVRAKEKLNDLYEALQSVVDGEILVNQNDEEYYLKNSDFDEPISIHNLSTGMKSFVILKMLLEKGCLKDKDVVILDEPEIHLHPQWQIAYAELIVLLQKYFELSVVVTTHSPYFVDAINLFSCKYGTDHKVNYYLSSNNDNAVTMECVTDKIDLIYKKMASPIQMLDTLRYELNNN